MVVYVIVFENEFSEEIVSIHYDMNKAITKIKIILDQIINQSNYDDDNEYMTLIEEIIKDFDNIEDIILRDGYYKNYHVKQYEVE